MDQIGAFLGPMMLFIVLTLKGGKENLSAYALGFLILALPAALALGTLLLARSKYPRPHEFEGKEKHAARGGLRKAYWLYLAGIACLALGFADFPLMGYHFVKKEIFPDNIIPVLYAVAMGVDAAAALFFGWLYDRKGIGAIIISSAISSVFAPFAFLGGSPALAIVGVALWGIGMGAQESILKAAVTSMTPKDKRGTAFGIFNAGFGAFWFIGSWMMGILYDRSILALVIFSIVAQLASLPFFFRSMRLASSPAEGEKAA